MTTAGAANPQDRVIPAAVTLYPQNPGQVLQQQRAAEQHYIAAGDSDKIAAASAPASAGGSAAAAVPHVQADLHRQHDLRKGAESKSGFRPTFACCCRKHGESTHWAVEWHHWCHDASLGQGAMALAIS